MKRTKVLWIVVATLFSLPYVLLFIAGSIWLYEYRMLLGWFGVSLLATLAGWWMVKDLREERILPRAEPDLKWPPIGHSAWEKVESLAVRAEAADVPLDRPDALWRVASEVLDVVAAHYHPESKNAAMDIPVPYVLRIVELVARDLREAASGYIPGSHILTLNDWRRIWKLAGWANKSYFWYRIYSFIVNSPAAVLREIRDFFMEKLKDSSSVVVKRWAVGFAVRRTGYYAIQLYGGYLTLDDVTFSPYVTSRSKIDDRAQSAREGRLAEEPLRIAVVGQLKAGKSSLINAIFGEERAATDIIPRTQFVEPFLLKRDGIPQAILLDTAGYEDGDKPGEAFDQLRKQLAKCDLIFLVCSAQSAARAADRRLLDAMRSHYEGEPDRRMPAVVVALTKIDRLRPLNEWNPPYDLKEARSDKAKEILGAIDAVAGDLAIGPEDIVPVCLEQGRTYNVDDALVPRVLEKLPEAERVKYLRCLREIHNRQYWEDLGRQAVRAGKLIVSLVRSR